MSNYQVQTVVEQDGVVTVRNVPFAPGENVRVLVIPVSSKPAVIKEVPLEGSILFYDRPTDPVADSDWEAAG